MDGTEDSTKSDLAEDRFKAFIKQSSGFVVAVVASVPMVSDYLNIVSAPKFGSASNARLLPMACTALASLVFLLIFWNRDQVESPRAGIAGIAAVFVGIFCLLSIPFVDPALAPVTVALYVFGFLFALTGAALVFVFGFVRVQERTVQLADIATRLDHDQWQSLLNHAQTLLAVRQALSKRNIHPRSREALQRSAENLLSEYSGMLQKLKAGTLELRGPAMDEIFSYFTQGVQNSFRALSRDDLPYWVSPDSKRYLAVNADLIRNGCAVERVFLLPKCHSLATQEIEAIRNQIILGIKVRIAYIEDCQGIVADDRDLDFGLFDDFAVSFWRFAADRVFKISTSQSDCATYGKIFDKVANRCSHVPGKAGGSRTLLESVEELMGWLDAHTRLSTV